MTLLATHWHVPWHCQHLRPQASGWHRPAISRLATKSNHHQRWHNDARKVHGEEASEDSEGSKKQIGIATTWPPAIAAQEGANGELVPEEP